MGAGEQRQASGVGEVAFRLPFTESRSEQKKASVQPQHDFQACGWTIDGRECNCGDVTHHHPSGMKWSNRFSLRKKESVVPGIEPILHHGPTHPTIPPAGTIFADAEKQPMREEVQRAFATFLRKRGSRELGISDELREFARVCLSRSTAPEAVSLTPELGMS